MSDLGAEINQLAQQKKEERKAEEERKEKEWKENIRKAAGASFMKRFREEHEAIQEQKRLEAAEELEDDESPSKDELYTTIKVLVKSVRNDVQLRVYDRDEILLLCDKVLTLLERTYY